MPRPKLSEHDKKHSRSVGVTGHNGVYAIRRYGSIQRFIDLAFQHDHIRLDAMKDLRGKVIAACGCGKKLRENNTHFVGYGPNDEAIAQCRSCKRKTVVNGYKKISEEKV